MDAQDLEAAKPRPTPSPSRSFSASSTDPEKPTRRPSNLSRASTFVEQKVDWLSSLCTDWWLVEITSWICAALCMCAIAGVLSFYDGKQLPERFPLGLKLNAYVSVLAAVAKLALAVPLEEALAAHKYLWFTTGAPKHPLIDFERFDRAARGPFGAVGLVWRTRFSSIATLGAIIFLLSLALDPFFQQLVSYPVRSSNLNPSRTPRIVSYAKEFDIATQISEGLTADQFVSRALPSVFRNHAKLPELDVFCSDESCKWPPFETLAVCGGCEDISSHLTFDCLEEPGDWRESFNPNARANHTTSLNDTSPTINETDPNAALRGRSCGWFFNASSTNPMLMTGYSLDDKEAGTLVMRMLNFHDPIQNDLYWGGSLVFKDIPTPIADWATVASANIGAVHRNETPEAYACHLRWCTKWIKASYSEGAYHETVLSTWTNDTQVPDPLTCTYRPDGSRDWLYHQNLTFNPPASDDTFFVSNHSMIRSRFALDAWIPNSLVQANDESDALMVYPLPIELGGSYTEATYSKDWLMKKNIPRVVDALAEGISIGLRDSTQAQIIYGTGSYVTYIQADWPYFTFPLVVLTSTLVMLIVTVCQTTKKDIWKGSSLTVLVHGLSADARAELQSVQSMRDLRSEAKRLRVFLNDTSPTMRSLDIERRRRTGEWGVAFVQRYFRNSGLP